MFHDAHHNRRTSYTRAGITAALLVAPAVAAAAPSYSFTPIADTTGDLGFFGFAPSISSSRIVVFGAGFDGGAEGGVFISSGGGRTMVADTDPPFLFFTGAESVNASGAVAFTAVLDDGSGSVLNNPSGIFVGNGGSITTIADESGPFADFYVSNDFSSVPSINASGTVAFMAELDTGARGVFTSSGGGATTIADDTGDFVSFNGFVSINDAGTVAFRGVLESDVLGVFTGDGGAPATIADSQGVFDQFGAPAINQAGEVVFNSILDNGRGAIHVWSDGELTLVADTSGGFDGFSIPSIGEGGVVAFLAQLDDGAEGIYTGGDPVADKVIQEGDTLFGSTVSDIDFFRGVSAGGGIIVSYGLANGVSGIAVAIPEEGCVADFNGDGTLNFFDVSLFLKAFQGHEPGADINGDEAFNFFDVSQYLAAYNAGCP